MGHIIVTGGAGYIGSHISKALKRAGFTPVAIDNLSGGFEKLVKWGPLEQGDVRESQWLDSMFAKYTPQAVIHCAGLISVSESVQFPEKYLDANFHATEGLIAAMQRAGIPHLIHSSTASVYGRTNVQPIVETHPIAPENPYAESKWRAEQAIEASGMSAAILRYFNAAGADAEGDSGELHDPETHLIPLAIQAAIEDREFTIFGNDYATPDGTAIRDYIHVTDLAKAHVAALKHLLAQGGFHRLNLGTGTGASVTEVVREVERTAGKQLRIKYATARAGDVPVLVADSRKALQLLAFRPQHSSLPNIIKTAFEWHYSQK